MSLWRKRYNNPSLAKLDFGGKGAFFFLLSLAQCLLWGMNEEEALLCGGGFCLYLDEMEIASY